MTDRRMINAFMVGLVNRAGGVDAAAALIGASTGRDPSKGTISKRLAGELSWPIEEVWAPEDAVGDRCVTRWRARNLPEERERHGLMQLLPDVARESGEAVSAVMGLMSGAVDRATARKEVAEARRALAALDHRLEDGGEVGDG